jgi:hypothetical protein
MCYVLIKLALLLLLCSSTICHCHVACLLLLLLFFLFLFLFLFFFLYLFFIFLFCYCNTNTNTNTQERTETKPNSHLDQWPVAYHGRLEIVNLDPWSRFPNGRLKKTWRLVQSTCNMQHSLVLIGIVNLDLDPWPIPQRQTGENLAFGTISMQHPTATATVASITTAAAASNFEPAGRPSSMLD